MHTRTCTHTAHSEEEEMTRAATRSQSGGTPFISAEEECRRPTQAVCDPVSEEGKYLALET